MTLGVNGHRSPTASRSGRSRSQLDLLVRSVATEAARTAGVAERTPVERKTGDRIGCRGHESPGSPGIAGVQRPNASVGPQGAAPAP
ncbi:MAG: hypothetical protein CMJ51_03540 [Planctomycetaceae bacterium]|nr:hypothetical protein [Planctomycetaceae bacterium]